LAFWHLNFKFFNFFLYARERFFLIELYLSGSIWAHFFPIGSETKWLTLFLLVLQEVKKILGQISIFVEVTIRK